MGRAALAVFIGLTALACGDRPPPPEPALAAHQLLYDTTHIVARETLRTLVQDTIRTVFTDTQRSATLDTIRTVLLRDETAPWVGWPQRRGRHGIFRRVSTSYGMEGTAQSRGCC